MRLGQKVQRIFDEFRRIAREQIGDERRTFDQAGVAEARLLSRGAGAIDERDVAAARLQMQRGADADNPGAKNDDIRRLHESSNLVAHIWTLMQRAC